MRGSPRSPGRIWYRYAVTDTDEPASPAPDISDERAAQILSRDKPAVLRVDRLERHPDVLGFEDDDPEE